MAFAQRTRSLICSAQRAQCLRYQIMQRSASSSFQNDVPWSKRIHSCNYVAAERNESVPSPTTCPSTYFPPTFWVIGPPLHVQPGLVGRGTVVLPLAFSKSTSSTSLPVVQPFSNKISWQLQDRIPESSSSWNDLQVKWTDNIFHLTRELSAHHDPTLRPGDSSVSDDPQPPSTTESRQTTTINFPGANQMHRASCSSFDLRTQHS